MTYVRVAIISRMSSMSSFTVHTHMWFLSVRYACLFEQLALHGVFSFLHQKNKKFPFFIHELMCFYEQASSRASWLEAFFCNLCNLYAGSHQQAPAKAQAVLPKNFLLLPRKSELAAAHWHSGHSPGISVEKHALATSYGSTCIYFPRNQWQHRAAQTERRANLTASWERCPGVSWTHFTHNHTWSLKPALARQHKLWIHCPDVKQAQQLL